MITVLIITFKFIIIIMETSLSNTCSSSVMNTNTIIQKPKHKILKKKNDKKIFHSN